MKDSQRSWIADAMRKDGYSDKDIAQVLNVGIGKIPAPDVAIDKVEYKDGGSPTHQARWEIQQALAMAGEAHHRGGHRHGRRVHVTRVFPRRPVARGALTVPRNKTLHGMFLLARFEHLLAIGRTDLISQCNAPG